MKFLILISLILLMGCGKASAPPVWYAENGSNKEGPFISEANCQTWVNTMPFLMTCVQN